MKHSVIPATQRPAWKALEAHHQELRKLHLRNLFAEDPKGGERFTAEAAGIYLDYSKNRITDETLKLLLQLAEESDLRARIDAMLHGERSTPLKIGPCCTSPCARREMSIVVDGAMSYRKYKETL